CSFNCGQLMATGPPKPLAIVYRCLQPFIPSDEEVAAGFISVLEAGAQLIGLAPAESSVSTAVLPGTCRVRYQNREGLVPTKYLQLVQADDPSTDAGLSGPQLSDSSSGDSAASSSRERRRHALPGGPTVFVSGPRYCTLCQDYLWNCGAAQCAVCKRVFHLSCTAAAMAAASGDVDDKYSDVADSEAGAGSQLLVGCDGFAPPPDDSHYLYLHWEPVLVEAWTSRMVLEWLCVANLSRFLDSCCKYLGQRGFPGGACLRGLTDQVLEKDWRMQDVPHRRAISAALEQLLAGYRDWPEADKAGTEWRLGHPDSPAGHRMRLASFAGHQTECAACGLRLLGIYQQGLQCTVCGRVAHRHCARFHRWGATGAEGDESCRPTVPPMVPSIVFGASIDEQVAAGEQQLPDESFRRKLDNYAESTNVYDSLAHSDQPALSDAPDSMAPEAASHLVPYIVRLCTYTVERESLTYPGDLLQFYRFRRTAADVEALRADFGSGVGPAALNKLDGKLAAQLLKLWLQELPTSLLPCQHYDKFVRLMDLPASQLHQQAVELRRLLSEAPDHHRATLQHLMCHFVQIFRRVRTADRQYFISWSRVFGQLLLRPAWSRVTGMVAGEHSRPCVVPLHDVAKGVLSHGRWGCVLPSFLVLNDPSQVDHISLPEQPWYWGDISKSEVQAVLANRPDGSFLVRNAANMSGGYTLTLKKDGENKLIRIYPRYKTGDRVTYGFSERATEFYTVAQVINHYTYNSLREYNNNLDVLLLYPISKFAGCPAESASKGNSEEMRQELLTLYQEMGREISDVFTKMDENIVTMGTLKDQQLEAERGAKCYSQVVLTLTNNIAKMDRLIERRSALEQLMKTNRDLQVSRMQMYRSRQEAAEKEAQRIRQDSQVMQAEVRTMRGDVRAIQEKRIRLKAILMTLYGVLRETVDAEDAANLGGYFPGCADSFERLSLAEDPLGSTSAAPWDPADWLDRQITKADPLLRHLDNAPIGTFLIHASRSGGEESLVLSVRSPCGVRFCKIFMELGAGQQQTGRCGFDYVSPTSFPSLEELVAHYRVNSLGKHNRDMDTFLLLPLKQLAQMNAAERTNNTYV
ncbi:hypothetical protein BOX15_Mlig020411g2, partial [Macrostomum lignano]